MAAHGPGGEEGRGRRGAPRSLSRAPAPRFPRVLFPRVFSAGPYQSRRRGVQTVPFGRGAGRRGLRQGRARGCAASRVQLRLHAAPAPPTGRTARSEAAALGRAAESVPTPPPSTHHPPNTPGSRAPAPRPRTRAAERMLIPVLLLLRRSWRRPRDPQKPACWRNSTWKKVSAPAETR